MISDVDDPIRVIFRAASLQAVKMAHRGAEVAVANRADCIRSARNCGASWDDIGAALGMSRQSAHKHFGGTVTTG